MVSSPMAVSPRETRNVWHGWRGLVCASLLLVALLGAAAPMPEARFFRIGTAATGGSYFEVGGLVASAISRPADGPPCDRGGSCGVPGLVAVAQATPGSIENLRLIESGQIESGFAQADLAGWAYQGVNLFAKSGPLRHLRAIASLFPEAAHLVVRADGPIHSLADLTGKTVSLGEEGSGTAADAEVLLSGGGLRGRGCDPRVPAAGTRRRASCGSVRSTRFFWSAATRSRRSTTSRRPYRSASSRSRARSSTRCGRISASTTSPRSRRAATRASRPPRPRWAFPRCGWSTPMSTPTWFMR